ncbi:hypothetical protein SETIT_4G272700v2 [Setaria italica]|uniref:MINDY deubiquitinase domain-containing protein n=2 Tax=Setaria italica TaxID=4555 RepID=A0A368QYY2_SETIT|nr:uncharacterized protein YGL082W [Setaria italica]RCV23103.1 hypothetical protein SETIT_4G272700v2 [Setaria italica]
MSESRYQLARAQFNGVNKFIACQLSTESSPLIALSNYFNLTVGPECKDFPPFAEESMLSKPIMTALEYTVSHYAKHNISVPGFLNKERLLQIVPSLAKGLHLIPGCRRCQDFIACDELYLFYVLNIKVIHGWVCDPNDKEFFSVLGNCSRSTLLKSISRPGGLAKLVEGTSNPSSLSKKIQKFAESGLTKYGLRILHEEIGERQLAIICINDQFDVIYKCSGDLFVLETDGHVLTKFGEALWKRLTLTEEESFYVTMHFDPVKGQKNIHKATEWLERKLSDVDDCGDKGKEQASKKGRDRSSQVSNVGIWGDKAKGRGS